MELPDCRASISRAHQRSPFEGPYRSCSMYRDRERRCLRDVELTPSSCGAIGQSRGCRLSHPADSRINTTEPNPIVTH